MAHEVSQSLSGASIGAALLVLVTGVVGVLLVFAGHRLLGVALACIGAIVGGVVGWAIGEVFLPSIPAWSLAVGAGFVGAIGAALSSRLTAAAALGAVLALAGWMSVASAERHGWLAFAPTGAASAAASASDGETTRPAAGSAAGVATDALRAEAMRSFGASVRERSERLVAPIWSPAVERRLGELRALIDDGVALIGRQWTLSSRPVRTLMLACAAMCGFLGLCLGVLASRWTAAFVTAIVGSVLVLLCAAASVQQFLGDASALPGSRAGWMVAWAILAMVGTAVQGLGRKAEGRAARQA